MKKEIKLLKFMAKSFIPAIGLAIAVLFMITPLSCNMDSGEIVIEETDEESPEIVNHYLLNENQVKVEFSEPVEIDDYSVEELMYGLFDIEGLEGNGTKEIVVTFKNQMIVDRNYIFKGVAVDKHGNSLKFALRFKAYNGRVPKIVINEIRNSYQRTLSGTDYKYKFEFVEFYAVTDGNLSGLEFQNASDDKFPKYEFPAVEVKAGDYIVLHLRMLEPLETCRDEIFGDLTLSTATDSCDTAIDLWVIDGITSRIGNSDILVIRNAMDGSVADAFVMAVSDLQDWKESFKTLADEVQLSGVWVGSDGLPSCSVGSAFNSDYITSSSVTRTISRQNTLEIPKEGKQVSKASDFIVTASVGSGASKVPGDTPGFENSKNKYVKKIM